MHGNDKAILLWFRRDLRLSDHVALDAAVQTGRPVIPLFIVDEQAERLGAAPKWRLGLGLDAFADKLKQIDSRLILRRGSAGAVLADVLAETGATSVYWTRAYDPDAIRRDRAIKADLIGQGVEARSFAGHLLFEPWEIATKSGQPYKVFTPMWRAVRLLDVAPPAPAPVRLRPPHRWPRSDALDVWHLGKRMHRGAEIVRAHVLPGEDAAHDRLDAFLDHISHYGERRDRLDVDGTSNLSEYLSLGEIGPRTVWHRVQHATDLGMPGTEPYLRQLVWREFAYHLMYHWPHLLSANWKSEWNDFPWRTDPDSPDVNAWCRARTGVPAVDAGLRQMYVTGRMHNRARMIVASYLTKHLQTHWKIGLQWFEDCLIDWDPAANAMGWQWVAGSGPDAAPYFRIFNPATQALKFDPESQYIRRWIAEGQNKPSATALAYFDAIPRRWGLGPSDAYPGPVVDLAEGRRRALALYDSRKKPVTN